MLDDPNESWQWSVWLSVITSLLGDNFDLALAAHVEQQLTGQQSSYLLGFWRHSPAMQTSKEILWTTEYRSVSNNDRRT